MRKHTPGPWGIERLHGEINVISCNERDGAAKDMGIVYVLARDVGGMIHGEQFDDRSEVEANARLIAAAPELLSLAKRWAALDGSAWHLVRYEEEKRELLAATNEAISKATA
ncbi:hypothetical protein [Pseudomonas aeruginosa]|uniref:hypothetical protein n=1 Tax=Pseudomonas aeruginosa TaxID=287 RepID=UPI002880B115|nr:hypothetical protein [Pseudomonas aeruginosa]